MNITVIGTGYVGLVTGACFAETGNCVTCVDIDHDRIAALQKGQIPFFEPGLPEIIKRNSQEERLRFTTDSRELLASSNIVFLCVGTPSQSDGSADLSYIFSAVESISLEKNNSLIVTIKSTVPVGTADKINKYLIEKGNKNICVASNPEFLREGSAVQDCLFPDRVVIGTDDKDVRDFFRQLYEPFLRTGNPLFIFDRKSAEMTKYAANALLALRISFMNEISILCDKTGADVTRVRMGMGADQRIGMQYLFPSIGFGGSCFPKDVRALQSLSCEYGLEPYLLNGTLAVNELQKKLFVQRIVEHFGNEKNMANKHIALWGTAFKAKTDDIRESPALTVIDELLKIKANISVFDPESMANTKTLYGNAIQYGRTAYSVLEGADALCVLTEWNQFRNPDFKRIKQLLKTPVIFDGRNLYDPAMLKNSGFTYYSIGRNSTV